MTTNKLKLGHVALYAKGWYKRNKNIWKDLQKVLTGDDYQPFTKHDVFFIIVRNLSNLGLRAMEPEILLDEIRPENCWKYGYRTNQAPYRRAEEKRLPRYKYDEAVIRYCLSVMCNMKISEIVETEPDYSLLPPNPTL